MAERDRSLTLTRESRIRRARDGRWFDDGVEVTHPGIVSAFDRWIDRADDGRYILKNAINWVYIEVEGAPILVRRVHVETNRIDLELSDQTTECLAEDTLREDADGVLWCDVRGGTMPARFTRLAQLGLEPALEEDERGPYLLVGSRRVRPQTEASTTVPE